MKNRGFTRQNFNAKISGGFTLIELLVVIAVIGILSSVVLASLNSARAKGRDAQRLQNQHELRTALLMYYDDHGYYPRCGDYETTEFFLGFPGGFTTRSTDSNWDGCLGVQLRPYISQVPKDMINGTKDGVSLYYYYYCPAASAASPTCGTNGVYINIYYETRTPNYSAMTIGQ